MILYALMGTLFVSIVNISGFLYSYMNYVQLYAMIHYGNLREIFDSLEILILIFSAISHDLDHPGLNNAFQVNICPSGRTLVYFILDRSMQEPAWLSDTMTNRHWRITIVQWRSSFWRIRRKIF